MYRKLFRAIKYNIVTLFSRYTTYTCIIYYKLYITSMMLDTINIYSCLVMFNVYDLHCLLKQL